MVTSTCRLIRKATIAVVQASAVAIALGACSMIVTYERDAGPSAKRAPPARA